MSKKIKFLIAVGVVAISYVIYNKFLGDIISEDSASE
jgi:hypothetical protein